MEMAKHQNVDIYARKPFVSEEKRKVSNPNPKEAPLQVCSMHSNSDYIKIAFGFVVGMLSMAMYNHFCG